MIWSFRTEILIRLQPMLRQESCSDSDSLYSECPCADPEGGGQRVWTPLENYKNIIFLSNTGPDPLKSTKLPIQHSMFGHHRPASETPFKGRFTGGPMMARYQWYLYHSSPHQTKKKEKKEEKKPSRSWIPSAKIFLDPSISYTITL